METFTLDSDIRSGVTVPIFIIVLLSAILRRYLTVVLNVGSSTKTSLEDVQSNQILARAQILCQNGGYIPLKSYVNRMSYFTKKETGLLWNPPSQLNPLQALVAKQSDPTAMFSMLKNQVVFVLLSAGLGYLISALFSGFLVAKAPFPLTYKFKSMLQRGIDVPNLDPNYVSSLSWYFFILLSSTSLQTLIHHVLGDEPMDTQDEAGLGSLVGGGAMGGAMMPPMPGMGGPDIGKLFAKERENLELAVYKSKVNTLPFRLAGPTTD